MCAPVIDCVCECVALVDVWGGIIATQVFTKRLVVKQLRERGGEGGENCVWPDACCFNLQLFISLGSKKEQAD